MNEHKFLEDMLINTTTINFTIDLDKNHTPERIRWQADEAESKDAQEARAIAISIWDPEKENTVRFDLWTKDMMQDEMSKFVFQTFLLMSEAFGNSTGNKEMASEIIEFAEHFGEKTGVIRPKNESDDKDGDDEVKPFELKI